MKKFLFVFIGIWTPTDEMKQAWGKWFMSLGDRMVDPGNPLGPGLEITHDGVKKLPFDLTATTGYTLINAADIDEAMKFAKTCPIVTGIRVYEAMSM